MPELLDLNGIYLKPCYLSLTNQTVYLNVLTWLGFGHIT